MRSVSAGKREKATMYVQDLAEFCHVLFTTTEMLFPIGWLRIQPILFCHLADIQEAAQRHYWSFAIGIRT
jgi:hypothetical protein